MLTRTSTFNSREAIRCVLFLLALFVVLFMDSAAIGQTESASLGGRVADSSGAALPEAIVEIKNVETGSVDQTKSNREGLYIFPSLRPGSYVLTVGKPGFRTVNLTGLTLYTQDKVSRNFSLSIGAVSESITVSAAAEHLETDNPAVGVLVNRDFVENMPLNGRSFQELIALAPGAVSDTNSPLGLYSFNGQRSDANYFTVDGVSANTNSAATQTGEVRGLAGILPAQTAAGTTQSLISLDALQEFKVQTSGYSAENGRQPGGQIALTSRAGTNDFHGSMYDYFRNEALDANSWFANANAIARQAHRQNDFGGTFGGPLLIPGLYNGRNKTFFFFSYEGLRLLLPQFNQSYVPTVAFRQFASPAWQPFFNAFPLPNGSPAGDQCVATLDPNYPNLPLNSPYGFSCSAQINASQANRSSIDSPEFRIDQTIGQKLQLFFRYWNTPSSGTGELLSQKMVSSQDTQGFTVGSTLRISGNLVNDARFNWTQNGGHVVETPSSFDGAVPYARSLIVPSQYIPAGGAASNFVSLGFSSAFSDHNSSAPMYSDYHTNLRQLNLVDSVAWTKGKHAFKFGADLRRLNSLLDNGQYSVGYFLESASNIPQAVADFADIRAGRPGNPTFNNLSVYGGATWKISSRLTLDYGIRWEFNPAPGASDGHYPLALTTANLDTARLAPTGTAQYQTAYDKVAPRLGFAYSIHSSQQHPLLVRGGYGVFYDTGQTLGAAGYLAYPFFADAFNVSPGEYTNVTIPLSPSLQVPPSLDFPLVPPYPSMQLNAPNLTLPYTEQWNLSLAAGLSPKNTLTASYVGNSGKKLLFQQYYSTLTGINPAFTQLFITSNGASSSYNSLQVQDQGQLAPGAQLIASYTWAHAIDDASTDYSIYPFPMRGNSDNDIRQALNVALNCQTPAVSSRQLLRTITHGWGFDTRFTAQTGTPIFITQSQYTIPPTQITAYVFPDLVPRQQLVLRNVPGDPFGWALNPVAFSPVPLNPDGSPVRLGDLPRNYVHGPAFWDIALAAQREFPLYERARLVFRVEAFNVLNHANAPQPDACFCSPSFGKISITENAKAVGVQNILYATGTARSLQILLKVQF